MRHSQSVEQPTTSMDIHFYLLNKKSPYVLAIESVVTIPSCIDGVLAEGTNESVGAVISAVARVDRTCLNDKVWKNLQHTKSRFLYIELASFLRLKVA